MKKVLILANSSTGLYKFRKLLIEKMIDNHCEVIVSIPDGEFIEDIEALGCRVVKTPVDRRGINPLKDLRLLFNYVHLFREIKPEMVITYTIKPNLYGGIVARIMGIPYACNITGLGTAFQKEGILKKVIVTLYRFALKKVKVSFFENIGNLNTFLDYNILSIEQTKLLNGAGVDLNEFEHETYPLKNEQLKLLFIGRVMHEKGFDELIHAARRIKKEFPKTVFDVVGPFEDDYKSTVDKLHEEKVIRYHGFQSDVKSFIKDSHCFILPSHHEGMANTLLESAAMGRPLITSNIHGCKEAVDEGENGYLVEVKNENELYTAIKDFIDLKYEDKKSMGQHSRVKMEKLFDKQLVVQETLGALF